jgi:hypothetical protein
MMDRNSYFRHYTGGIRTRIVAIAESIADINKLKEAVRTTVRRCVRTPSLPELNLPLHHNLVSVLVSVRPVPSALLN